MSEVQTPVRRVLIAEDDDAARTFLATVMKGFGFETTLAADGQQACQHLERQTFDLIVQDWKLPEVSGLALFNRLRSNPAHATTPALITSGFLKSKDFRLLEEYPFTRQLEKPFAQNRLRWKMDEVAHEVEWFLKQQSAIDQIFQSVAAAESQVPLEKLQELVQKAPNPVPLGLHLARKLRALGAFGEAMTVLVELLRRKPQCLVAITELAKVKLHRGDLEEALKLLKNAHGLSPDNLERITLIGQTELHRMRPEEAQSWFGLAEQIDPTSEHVQTGKRLAVGLGDYMSDPSNSGMTLSFAGFLNAQGISMVRSGDLKTGIDHYRAALEYVFHNEPKSKLAFNVGMGYLRGGEKAHARDWFDRAYELSGSTFEKAKSYRERMQREMAQPAAVERGRKSKAKSAKNLGDQHGPEKLVETGPKCNTEAVRMAESVVNDASLEPMPKVEGKTSSNSKSAERSEKARNLVQQSFDSPQSLQAGSNMKAAEGNEVGSDRHSAGYAIQQAGAGQGEPGYTARTEHGDDALGGLTESGEVADQAKAGYQIASPSIPGEPVVAKEWSNHHQNDSDATEGQAEEPSLPNTIQELCDRVPEVERLKSMLEQVGQYVPKHLNQYLRLARKHGVEIFHKAVLNAIEHQNPSADSLSFWIDRGEHI